MLNQIEADALASELTQVDTVISTREAEGVTVRRRGSVNHIAAPTLAVVDTTGAGDASAGVLSTRLAAGSGMDGAIRAGIAAAVVSVTREQCIPSYPTRAEIEALMASMDEAGS